MSASRPIHEVVRELLEDLDLYRLPVVPKEVCRRLGIEYREYRYEGTEGTLVVVGGHQLIGVNSNTRETTRRAFTCAHELGHYYFDLGDGACSSCSADELQDHSTSSPRELRANAFAAELLMPRDLFLGLIESQEPSWQLIVQLAETCGASIQATAQRYVQLAPHGCWLAVMRNGRVYRYAKNPKVLSSMKTHRPITLPTSLPSTWQTAPARIWLGEGWHTKDRKIYQSFMPRNQYGETLALIWDRHRQFQRWDPLDFGVGKAILKLLNHARRALR